MWAVRCHRLLLAALLVLAMLLAVIAIATEGSAHQGSRASGLAALPIATASLTQEGRQLSWHVVMERPFSAIGLQHSRRSLCLALERVRSHVSVGELCVQPRRSGQIALDYTHETRAGPGRSDPIEAAISRSSFEEITAKFLASAIGIRYKTVRWQVLSELAISSCRAAGATRGACPPLLATYSGLAKLHTPLLAGCVPAGPSLVYGGSPKRRELALTFDDGPWPNPPSIEFVRLLARDHVAATFFEIGRQIPEYDPTGATERAMLADGDLIGDHTWTHPDMDGLAPAQQTSELELTAEAIRRATGFEPCLWRPPYGDTDHQLESLARSLGFLTVMWNVDPQDWALPGVGAIYGSVVANARNGSIVIQHFGGGPRYETLSAIPHEIATLRARGYRFVTVAQLLGLKLVYK